MRRKYKSGSGWIGVIQDVMTTVRANSIEFAGRVFATSRGLEREPFVKALMIAAGVLMPIGKLNKHFVIDHGERDPHHSIGRRELYAAVMDAFYPSVHGRPQPRCDSRILNRMLYEVDTELFDQLLHWDLWASNDGARFVSTLTIKRYAKAAKELNLTNPSGQCPDHPWDRPEGDPDFDED